MTGEVETIWLERVRGAKRRSWPLGPSESLDDHEIGKRRERRRRKEREEKRKVSRQRKQH